MAEYHYRYTHRPRSYSEIAVVVSLSWQPRPSCCCASMRTWDVTITHSAQDILLPVAENRKIKFYGFLHDINSVIWGSESCIYLIANRHHIIIIIIIIIRAPVYKFEINGRGNSLRWPRNTLYSLTLALTSPTSGGHSIGIVRLRTKGTEFSLITITKIHVWGEDKCI
jgi:hypothetical protein